MQKAPRISKTMEFHYLLDLDEEGKVVGGQYYNDSKRIDMLWVPLNPPQGGRTGNERGNPYISVKEVMAIWQASVPEELVDKWLNIDPLLPKEEGGQEPAAEPEAVASRPKRAESRQSSSRQSSSRPRKPSRHSLRVCTPGGSSVDSETDPRCSVDGKDFGSLRDSRVSKTPEV